MDKHEPSNKGSSGGQTINLITGEVTASDAANLMYAHGVLMSIAWGIIAPFGIFASRQRQFPPFNRPEPKGFWFLVHRISMGSVVMFIVLKKKAIFLMFFCLNDRFCFHFFFFWSCVFFCVCNC